jgi:ketosteroid isomerase-like protein
MSTRERVSSLITFVERGDVLGAIVEFYDENVSMQDNANTPTLGREANLERERAFFAGITVHQHRALATVVDGDLAVVSWLLEFTGADGRHYRLDQVAHQEWKGGKIIRERFYYDSAAVLVQSVAA